MLVEDFKACATILTYLLLLCYAVFDAFMQACRLEHNRLVDRLTRIDKTENILPGIEDTSRNTKGRFHRMSNRPDHRIIIAKEEGRKLWLPADCGCMQAVGTCRLWLYADCKYTQIVGMCRHNACLLLDHDLMRMFGAT